MWIKFYESIFFLLSLPQSPFNVIFLLLLLLLLLSALLLCDEFVHDPIVISSLLKLRHIASNTPMGLSGTGTDRFCGANAATPTLILSDRSLIIFKHLATLSCKRKHKMIHWFNTL